MILQKVVGRQSKYYKYYYPIAQTETMDEA